MDEPTNHIDIDTKEMLEEALDEYQGTLFFVSHDRYFINKLAERVINIEDQTFKEYLGNYDYFKEQKIKKLTPSENTDSRKKIDMNFKYRLTKKIEDFIADVSLKEIGIECSDSQVVQIIKDTQTYYLKIAKKDYLQKNIMH